MPDLDSPDAGSAFSRDYGGSIDDVSPADSGRKWVVARVNTDAVDRLGTVVDPAGMDRADYLKNPVVLWEHGKDPVRGRVPIGRNAWIKPRPERRDILAKTVFADDEFSRGLFELYRDGALNAWSINGKESKAPGRCGPPTAAEVRARPDLARCSLIYRSWALTEYSAVAVPGNADCLTEAVSRGLWLPDALRALVPATPTPAATPAPAPTNQLPALRGRTFEDVQAAMMRRVEAEAGAMIARAYRDAQDLARGRV